MYENQKSCKHATCQGACRREKKQRKFYQIPKQKNNIRKVSKKRQPLQTLYQKRSKVFREENPSCQIKSPVCIHRTQGVHHLKGKATADLLVDEKFWMAACNPCNLYCETNSKWAYENQKKLSKF